MLFRTHFLFGVFAWLVLDYFVEMPLFVFGFVMLGAVFVDVDSSKSRVGRKFLFLNWFVEHRGFFHSLVGCFVLSGVVGMFNLWAGFGFFVGYSSHLVLDSFTKMGIRLFWPFGFKIRGFIRSGGWAEDVLFVLVLFGDLVLVFGKLFWGI